MGFIMLWFRKSQSIGIPLENTDRIPTTHQKKEAAISTAKSLEYG